MSTKNKKRVRLRRDHIHNGVRKKAGTVLKLNEFLADWLISEKRAVPLR
jgi:hypothetical protein